MYFNGYLPYVFPLLQSEEPAVAFREYQSALSNYNRRLKELSRLLRITPALSSYTARHSWATAARNHNTPISIISAGMGHASERTTQIYLTLLESTTIDPVNQPLLTIKK